MPIRAEWRHHYDDAWDALSLRLKTEANWCCTGSPAFPDCRARHGVPHPVTGAIVVLTTAHRDHNPANNDPANLAVWCNRCHNTFDADFRARTRAATRRARINNGELFGVEP